MSNNNGKEDDIKSDISGRFEQNLERVRNLVEIYSSSLKDGSSGRRSCNKTDILRAAVVLLHATMEELLRSLTYWKLPISQADTLKNIPLFVKKESPYHKFDLTVLAKFRGKSVDDVIVESVNEHLNCSNYSSTDDISAALKKLNITVDNVNSDFPLLVKLIQRRHHIVHRADRNDTSGRGNHKYRSLGLKEVNRWIEGIESTGKSILNEIN
ncbi:MAG: hypothetical protein H3C30_02880 [Candidatus Hydrogenedentes bacterium]|nr:hypothetical protein [Candidatus Hydrogenedentota bacterium]